jgi:rubrerythrin
VLPAPALVSARNLGDSAFARRDLLRGSGRAVLSAAAIGLLVGSPSLIRSAAAADPSDVEILNSALGAELQAIAAYQAGAESGLLTPGVLDVAVKFQGHHKEHAELLRSTVEQLGGTPVEAKADYAFPLDTLKAEADVLRFAAGLEKGAVSAYLAAVPLFGDRVLAQAAASILGDEAMHWAVLRAALGEDPVPAAFVV